MIVQANIDISDNFLRDMASDIAGSDSFIQYVVEQISMDEIVDGVAEDLDWTEISDAIYENVRDNNLDDLADSLASHVSDTLMEGEEFCDLIRSEIDKAIGDSNLELIKSMNDAINKQAIAIAQLTKTVDSMQSKKFWKKIGKGK